MIAGIVAASLVRLPTPAFAALSAPQKAVLVRYLGAIRRGDYAAAFAVLTADERRYFASSRNLASVFAADRLHVDGYLVVGSTAAAGGVVALVRERVRFFDHAHQTMGSANGTVRYAIVADHGTFAVKDPFHPWFAFAPPAATATAQRLRVTLRKVSFYTGRVELVVTFANLGDAAVTVLPYGRSVLRDDAGTSLTPLRGPGITDRIFFEGLRLPPSGQYTGALTFGTPARFVPHRLAVTFAPALFDGADAPFDVTVPSVDLPRASDAR